MKNKQDGLFLEYGSGVYKCPRTLQEAFGTRNLDLFQEDYSEMDQLEKRWMPIFVAGAIVALAVLFSQGVFAAEAPIKPVLIPFMKGTI